MKKIKIIIILLITILLLIIYLLITKNIHNNSILRDNHNQVEILHEIYTNMCNIYDIENIIVDDSSYFNFITNEKYEDKDIEYLKDIEIISNEDVFINHISNTYNKHDNVLCVTISSSNGGIKNSYKLTIENDNIKYEQLKIGNIWNN